MGAMLSLVPELPALNRYGNDIGDSGRKIAPCWKVGGNLGILDYWQSPKGPESPPDKARGQPHQI